MSETRPQIAQEPRNADPAPVTPDHTRQAVTDALEAQDGPSQRLRRAAALVEQRAAAATPGPWQPEYALRPDRTVKAVFVECDGEDCDHDRYGHVDGTCAIGAMHSDPDNRWAILAGPQTGPHLAAILRQAADGISRCLSPAMVAAWHHELALADAILRTETS